MEKTIRFPRCLVDRNSIRWNLPSGARARFGQGYVNDMALSPDGKYLAVAGDVGVWFYDLSTQSLITMSDKGQAPYSAITFSSDSELVCIADSSGIARVFDIISGTCLAEFDRGRDRGISELAFSFDSQCLAASSGWRDEDDRFRVDVWQVPKSDRGTGSCLRSTYEGTSPLAFSSDSCLLACAAHAPTRCISPVEEGRISVWDVARHKRIAYLIGPPHHVGSLSFSPCGQLLAAGDWSGTVYVWDITSEHLHRTYRYCGEYYMLVSYSPAGALYAAGVSRDSNTLIVWDLEQARTCYTSKEQSRYFPVHFSEGTRLAFGSQADFHVYTLGTAEHRKVSHLHRAKTSDALVFSPDQEKLLSTWHKGIFLWPIANPQQPPEVFEPCIGTANEFLSDAVCLSTGVSPHGKCFTIAASQNTLGLWEIGNNTPLVTFTTRAEPKVAAFSPTAKLLACRDEDARIYIWDTRSGQLRNSFQALYPEVQGMVFSPDGQYLAGGGDLLYDIVQGEKVTAFDMAGRSIHLFSHDSTQFFCDTSKAIEVWDIHLREKIGSHLKPETWGCSSHVEALALSPCGKYLAGSCGEATEALHLWGVVDSESLAVFKSPSLVDSLVFSADSTLLASGSIDGTILLWDLKPYLENR